MDGTYFDVIKKILTACSVAHSIFVIFNYFSGKDKPVKKVIRQMAIGTIPTGVLCDCFKYQQECINEMCPYKASRQLQIALLQTKSSLDICMYLITSGDMCRSILALVKKGVLVRIMVDSSMYDDAFGKNFDLLLEAHVPIKKIDLGVTMHNKFAILDGKLLVTGSANWTTQAFTDNFESIIFTEEKKMINQFQKFFDTIWGLKGNKF